MMTNKYAFLFPGQGSQYTGMGKALYEQYAVARETFQEASDVLGIDMQQLCFHGSNKELMSTENTQPAILTASVAAFRVFSEQFGIKPDYCAGHSLGEFSALTCAGAIAFGDALRIVRRRGILMGEVSGGAMAAVTGLTQEVVEEECRRSSGDGLSVVISNLNAPQQIVISGHRQAIEQVKEALTAAGGEVIPLRVSAPFHSPLMESAAVQLREELERYSYSSLQFEVLSNVTAGPYAADGSGIIGLLTEQMTSVVKWSQSVKLLEEQGVTHAIELGPKTVLRNLMGKNKVGIRSYSFDNEADAAALLADLPKAAGEEAEDKGLQFMIRCLAIAVCTRNENRDHEAYEAGVAQPYRQVRIIVEECEQAGVKPSEEQIRQAADMLHSVFETKLTPQEERQERYNQLYSETGIAPALLAN